VIERTIEIVNSLGLHARPAAQFVRMAAGFSSDIELARDEVAVNGKSIMGVMMLAAECGSSVVVRARAASQWPAWSSISNALMASVGTCPSRLLAASRVATGNARRNRAALSSTSRRGSGALIEALRPDLRRAA
jgi:phosphocarrier protein